MDIYGEEGFIKVVDTEKDSLLFSLAKRGEGPNEYLHVGNINICEDETNGITLGIYDPVLKAYRTYSYDSLCMQGGTTLPISTGHLPRESRYTELLNLNSAWLATDLTGKG
ncbi:MAG: hypothetical protein LBT83_05250, partial [Tannerella sp.]|nr:hypothetical protein [Tannerella sp.]